MREQVSEGFRGKDESSWERHTGRDTLDTTTTGKTTDGGLGDTLDVVAENLAMTLGAALSEALATFAA